MSKSVFQIGLSGGQWMSNRCSSGLAFRFQDANDYYVVRAFIWTTMFCGRIRTLAMR